MNGETIDRLYQDYATCPHCGYRHEGCNEWFDSYDDDGEDERDCDDCGKIFFVQQEIEVTYTTRKKKL